MGNQHSADHRLARSQVYRFAPITGTSAGSDSGSWFAGAPVRAGLESMVLAVTDQSGSDMTQALVYVDTSEVREGSLEELKGAIRELAEFVEANEPQLISYNAYFSDDGSQMTVVHVHADSSSLEYHMDVAGPRFGKFADLLTLSSIRIYGEPSETVLNNLHDKARLLGGSVTVHGLHAGFSRFGSLGPKA